MNKQVTDTILMIRPTWFYGNDQTAVNNFFQKPNAGETPRAIQDRALQEFNELAALLESKGIEVLIFDDTPEPHTPDSIFPNNWVSFHQDGQIITYPMFAENRRLERRGDILEKISSSFEVKEIIRLDAWEKEGLFLEGTGSLVLDREHDTCFVAISDRAHGLVVENFQEITGYHAVTFRANQTYQGRRVPIYHTNVMMYLGEAFATIGLACIDDPAERKNVLNSLETLGKEIIDISEEQVANFAGNGLQLASQSGDQYIVMSSAAYRSLHQNQVKVLEKYGEIIHSPLDTIEYYGGGSARCMIAEIFLSKQTHV